jgi:hypothetical protein
MQHVLCLLDLAALTHDHFKIATVPVQWTVPIHVVALSVERVRELAEAHYVSLLSEGNAPSRKLAWPT